MVSQSQCQSSYCTVNGTTAWNFTSPLRRPRAAFEAGVLKVRAHACDRDYEHHQGLLSCAPRQPYGTATRTRTYRRDKSIPIVRHADLTNVGAGFLGAGLDYLALGYSSTTAASTLPHPVLCSSLGICITQSEWKEWFVNGVQENPRLVAGRNYTKADMMSCGSMGYAEGTRCVIDSAVVPLFYIQCPACTSGATCSAFCDGGLLGRYPTKSSTQLEDMATTLNNLFQTMRQQPTTWDQYLTAVDAAAAIWTKMGDRSLPTYPKAGKPMGLYYLLSYGAYEVPFSWWFRYDHRCACA